MPEEPLTIRWVISGRVQQVGFRWFVLRRAADLRVKGWARNLADGRVEVVGRGTAEDLRALETELLQGPLMARVDNVEKGDSPHDIPTINSFDIK